MKTCILIDDSATMRRILKNGLAPLDFECLEAANGWEALRQLREGPVHLVVTDWNMPGMSGLELVRAIRTDSHTTRLPVLMVTANATHSEVLQAMEAGVDDYLVKPFSVAALKQKVTGLVMPRAAESDFDTSSRPPPREPACWRG